MPRFLAFSLVAAPRFLALITATNFCPWLKLDLRKYENGNSRLVSGIIYGNEAMRSWLSIISVANIWLNLKCDCHKLQQPINSTTEHNLPENCRHSGTDYLGGDLAKVNEDTEEKCVKHCQMVSNCIAITFVGPNPSFYPSSVQGCYLKKGGWTVKTGARSANMVSVDIRSVGLCRYTVCWLDQLD